MSAPKLSFPTNVEEFADDERISFSKLDKKYIAVHDDGSEYEFDGKTRTWLPTEDDGDEDEPTEPLQSRKRKDGPYNDREPSFDSSSKQRPSKKPKNKSLPAPKQNTAVYVTGLPPDATVDEIYELFSRKGGIIAEEIDSGDPRIKMYTDAAGNFKGDALVVFFKPQSVSLAVMLLDETDFRISPSGLGCGKIRVQAADSSYKKTTYEDGAAAGSSGNGDSNAKSQPLNKNDKDRVRDRQKVIKKTQKLEAKLADWDDDDEDPYAAAAAQELHKKEKVVILKHMFTLQELDEDPKALLEIKEDVREECEKLGAVTNVVLYDLEPEGIISVKFTSPEEAAQCVKVMNGRSFAGQVVEAYVSAGREKFRESRKKDGSEEEE